MARITPSLTATQIEKAKSKSDVYTLTDGQGLFFANFPKWA